MKDVSRARPAAVLLLPLVVETLVAAEETRLMSRPQGQCDEQKRRIIN